MERDRLADYLNDWLEISRFKDYSPNGLQVEGKA
ncbi:MAG: Nif3-like dinuclear metal center protein, partial [Betaproteobacteria bacterium]|nr:Nif3-like dinuclear metal center protein [Betaproteobacteria bacterium]